MMPNQVYKPILMYDRNKNKLKIEINKALQTINNLVKPTSSIKEELEQSNRDIQIDRADKIHGKDEGRQKRWWMSAMEGSLSSVNIPKIHALTTIAHPIPISTIRTTRRICTCSRHL
jgi:hypothetical protein